MKLVDITEAVADTIVRKIINEWKHEGYVDRIYGNAVDFYLDDKQYTLSIICHDDEGESK